MYRIVKKDRYAGNLYGLWIEARNVAEKVRAGQFFILITQEKGERVPMTVADYDREKGLIYTVFLVIGKTTTELSRMEEGQELFSVSGPMGTPSEIEKYGRVVCVGGGTGIAAIYPIARELKKAGNEVISILGAKTRELIFMERELRSVSDEVVITTDDGSYGKKGFVTDALRDLLENDVKKVWAAGPAIMMKNVALVTKPYDVDTIVSLNAIMVDATGMCGTCRVTVGGETKLTCVDGPEFNGHTVDWDEFMNRLVRYKEEEEIALKKYIGGE